jgi:prepilin-type N-terminal cleavage/methylation domain-containing protein
MIRIAHKKNGFTLLELLIVISIMVVVTTSLGAGVLYLQNSVRLDNSVRDLKSEIQSTQNLARNSFFSDALTASTAFTDVPITVGWLLTLESTSSSNSVSVIKRSIYFKVPVASSSTYDYGNLRSDIIALRSVLAGDLYYCDSSDNFIAASNASRNVQVSTFDLKCTTSSLASKQANEYIVSDVKNLVSIGNSSFPATALPACNTPSSEHSSSKPASSAISSINLFFTAGYGEPASPAGADCQIQIKAGSDFGGSTRSVMVNKDTGGAGICGNYCEKPPVVINPIITVKPTIPSYQTPDYKKPDYQTPDYQKSNKPGSKTPDYQKDVIEAQ